jgi:hypothetical protein
MWRKILSFFGWLGAAFFLLIGFVGLTQTSAIAFSIIIWGLIFLPPLYRITSRYGWKWNIGGRAIAFFLSVIIAGLSTPPQQSIQPTPTATASRGAAPTISPIQPEIPSPTPTEYETPQPAPSLDIVVFHSPPTNESLQRR